MGIHRNITCPFCSLLCDDLTVTNVKEELIVKKNGCQKARALFQRPDPASCPMVNGRKTGLDDAIKHASDILRRAKHPLISGSATDVKGSRELLLLAEKSAATLDHVHGDAMACNVRVMQNRGWITTTFAEVKNRADLVIFLGTDAVTHYPRFFERLIWNQPSLAGLKKNAREIVYIGNNLNTSAGVSPLGKKPLHIPARKNELNALLGILKSLLSGSTFERKRYDESRLNLLEKLRDAIGRSSYGVIVWDATEFPDTDGDITVQCISDLVKDLNKQQRFAGLSLGGSNGANSFMNVCTWQSGFPLRISYRQGYPEHDLHVFREKTLVQNGNIDALLWLSSFDTSLHPPTTNIPRIILSRPTRQSFNDADVFIPVGTPGLDHAGNLMRADNVICLPLTGVRNKNLPAASQVLKQIQQGI